MWGSEIRVSHPKPPGKERRRVAPDSRLAIAKHDNNNVAARPRTAADQAVSSGLSVTGFHPVAVRQALQNFVRVFQLSSASIGVAKNKLWKANN